MRVAVFTSSGKTVDFIENRLLVDGQAADFDKLIEYDQLGTLTWVSDEMRAWAYTTRDQVASVSAVSASPTRVERQDPAYRLGIWIGRNRVLAVLMALIAVGILAAFLVSLLGGGNRAVVTEVYPSIGMGTIRDISDGEVYSATPVAGLTVYVGDEVRYEDGTYENIKSITAVTKPAQAR